MKKNTAIEISNLSKAFTLPHNRRTSLKDYVIHPFSRTTKENQEVLKDINFEIKKGDFFGIVGRNGSGKSTLLKIIAGVYSPTTGGVSINGTLVPFIELGVGFNPELTARDNVYLNSSLLGFSRSETADMYHDIVSFAELENHMDQKLKNFSSGMQVRLAFSIAIRAKSDILVLDEVLAVGDEAFQKKCIDIFEKYKAAGQTVVLVTHDMETIKKFCNKAVLINKGSIVDIGDPSAVTAEYTALNNKKISQVIVEENQKLEEQTTAKISIINGVKHNTSFPVGSYMTVEISWPKKLKGVKNLGVALIKNSGEYMFGTNTLDKKNKLNSNKARYTVKLSVEPGTYYVMAGLFGDTDNDIIEFIEKGPKFLVTKIDSDKDQGMVRLENTWSY